MTMLSPDPNHEEKRCKLCDSKNLTLFEYIDYTKYRCNDCGKIGVL